MAMIAFAIITIPKMSNELIAAMSKQSPFARAHYNPKTSRSSHIIICGDCQTSSIKEFFDELFHEDHANDNLHAVILQPGTTTPGTLLIAVICSSLLYLRATK